MAERRRLPVGLTPRLLCQDAAAAYCGVIADTFDKHIRPHVPPVEIGSRRLWDVKVLDRWLDEQSGLADAPRPLEGWLEGLGDDRENPRR